MTLTLPDDLVEKLEAIAKHQNRTPAEVLRDLLDTVPTPPTEKKRRIPGLNRGSTVYVSDDFDDYLGDDFWFGDDEV